MKHQPRPRCHWFVIRTWSLFLKSVIDRSFLNVDAHHPGVATVFLSDRVSRQLQLATQASSTFYTIAEPWMERFSDEFMV